MPKEKQTAKLLWRPPEEGWIKINVDGSYVERTGQASAGVIIRDHNGHVLVSAWMEVAISLLLCGRSRALGLQGRLIVGPSLVQWSGDYGI